MKKIALTVLILAAAAWAIAALLEMAPRRPAMVVAPAIAPAPRRPVLRKPSMAYVYRYRGNTGRVSAPSGQPAYDFEGTPAGEPAYDFEGTPAGEQGGRSAAPLSQGPTQGR